MNDNLKVYININVYVMVFFEGLKCSKDFIL